METEQQDGGRRNKIVIVISVLGLVVLAGMILSLLRWVVGLVVLAAIGYGIWYFVGPKLTGSMQRRREEKARRQAGQQAKQAEASREKNIEAALDEIKRSTKQE